ncbi:MAG: hypothetical protein HY587_04905 [Candidatus Omnitrophica bacterium]|nr:hypothetical protein [Candidatus Omnitrophota bacterium]
MALTLILLSLFSPRAFADVTFTFNITERFGADYSESRTEKIYIKGRQMKIVEEGKTAQIFDLDSRRICFIDFGRAQFFYSEPEQFEETLRSQKEAVRAQFADMLSEQLRSGNRADALRDPSAESYHQIQIEGGEKDVRGRKCQPFLIESSQKRTQACAANNIAGQDELLRIIALLQLYFQDAPFILDALRIESLLLTRNLFPLETVTSFNPAGEQNFTEEKLLSDIDSSKLEDSVFLPPREFSETKIT